MKPIPDVGRRRAFTLIELLCVLAIIGILAALLLPALSRGRARVLRVQCVSDLRQIGVAFHAFAHDHNGEFPMNAPTQAGGTLSSFHAPSGIAAAINLAWWHFQAISNELITPQILICPADSRVAAPRFCCVKNDNVSYFIGLNASMARPNSVLAGDRNLTNDWLGSAPLLRLGPEYFLRWTHEMHHFKGNLLFADGHVAEQNSPNLLAANLPAGEPARLLLPAMTPAVGTAADRPVTAGRAEALAQSVGAFASRGRVTTQSTPTSPGLATNATNPTRAQARPATNSGTVGVFAAKPRSEQPEISVLGQPAVASFEPLATSRAWATYLLLFLLLAALLALGVRGWINRKSKRTRTTPTRLRAQS